MTGNSDHFSNSSSSKVETNFSFYKFTKDPNFFINNAKLEELEFPEIFENKFKINNLFFNHKKDDENVEENVILVNIEREELEKKKNLYDLNNFGIDENYMGKISVNENENENKNEIVLPLVSNKNETNINEKIQNFTDEHLDDLDFFENQINDNMFNQELNLCNITTKKEFDSDSTDKFKVIKLKQDKLQSSSNKNMITKEFFSQQINNICNVACSNRNQEIIEIENKLGMSLNDKSQTHCPNYETFSEEILKEEMKKFGMKPGSNKFMVKQLNAVWHFINMNKLPDSIKNELTKFLSPNDNINQIKSSNLDDSKFKISSINSNNISSVTHLNEVKKEKIISTIIDHTAIWLKILKFKKVDLKEIKDVLNKKGIIVENETLKDYLSELGVIFNQPR